MESSASTLSIPVNKEDSHPSRLLIVGDGFELSGRGNVTIRFGLTGSAMNDDAASSSVQGNLGILHLKQSRAAGAPQRTRVAGIRCSGMRRNLANIPSHENEDLYGMRL